STTPLGASSTNSFQYTGRESDGTGLYYLRARYYSPRLQRFVSEDPIGFVAGVNFYAYTYNNPMNWIDPNGLDVTVTYYPGGAYTAGHIGINVNTDATVGFGPRDWDYNTAMKVIDKQDVPGAVQSDSDRIPGLTVIIQTTPEQDQAMINAI